MDATIAYFLSLEPIESLRLLSSDQKNLLHQTWEYISKDEEQLGENVFGTIFQLSPNAKRFFSFPESDYVKGTVKSDKFKFHAMQFMKVISMSLCLLDNGLAELQTMLHTLGGTHVNVKPVKKTSIASKNLPTVVFNANYYWSVFNESALQHIRLALEASKRLPVEQFEEAMMLWRVLVVAISNTIKEGLQLANDKRLSSVVNDELVEDTDS